MISYYFVEYAFYYYGNVPKLDANIELTELFS
jgi:hypothetical protein